MIYENNSLFINIYIVFLQAQGLNIAENSLRYFGSLIIQNNWNFLMIQIKILFLDNG